MKISEQTLTEWKLLRKHTDIAEMNRHTGLSRYKISLAINYGVGDEETLQQVTKYFEKRKRKQTQIQNEASPY